MSTRRTHPFTSSASVSTRRDSGRSARASTSTADTAAAPTDISNEPSTSSPHSPLESNRSVSKRRDSPRSARTSTSTSNIMGSPTYNATGSPPCSPNEPDLPIVNDRSERRVRGSSASFPSTSSVTPPESETAFERAETPETPPTPPSDTVSVRESPVEITKSASQRYIYYRVYAEDGAIPTSHPVYSDDPYLGRISAKLVTPPQTAINLRHCLSGAENIDEDIPTILFVSASSQTSMDDTDRVPILAYPGPGCMPDDPMALVVIFPEDRRPLESAVAEADLLASQEVPTPFETEYLYYQVYKKRGAVPSKQPADPNDSYVGRISVDSVPPPHTAKSIIRCISKVEHIENSMQSQLYVNISSESPIEEGYISILTSDRPGFTPEDPLAFVEPYPAFTNPMRVITSWSSNSHPGWLVTRAGEILHTTSDSPRNQPVVTVWGPTQLLAYEAANEAGKMGFVLANSVEPVDDDAASII